MFKTYSIPGFVINQPSNLGVTAFIRVIDLAETEIVKGAAPLVELLESRCDWCAQTYHSMGLTVDGQLYGLVTSETLHFRHRNPSPIGEDLMVANSSSTAYYLDTSNESHTYFSNLIRVMLSARVYSGDLPPSRLFSVIGTSYRDLEGSHIGQRPCDSGHCKYKTGDRGESFKLTSGAINHGDNLNATVVKGKAYGSETYLYVRWVWLAWPFLETLLTTSLLVTTMVMTKQSSHPLLKFVTTRFPLLRHRQLGSRWRQQYH